MLRNIFIYLLIYKPSSNKLIRIKSCLIIGIFFSAHLFSQDIILQGKVINKITNEPISTVSVRDNSSHKGSITDVTGSFKLSLPIGIHQIEFSHIGYTRIDTIVHLSKNHDIHIYIYLNPLAISVEEITIFSEVKNNPVSSIEMGSFSLTNKELKILPSLLGEVDPLKLIQLTPGIQTSSTGGGGFYVRGGGVDQNLILYDNTSLYNPGHLLGIFSIFNSDLIRNVSVIKSGIPAQYGGKLASVIKLDSYKGNIDSLKVIGSVGLIFSKLTIDGPLIKDKASFILGARRTYIGMVVNPIIKQSSKETSFLNKKNNYNFYDFNAGASIKLSNSDYLSLSAYHGRDNYNISQSGFNQNNFLKWGNSMASLLWDHNFHPSSNLHTNLSWTKYNFILSGTHSEYSFGLFSAVEDLKFKTEFSTEIGQNKILSGIELTEHIFIPGKIDAKTGNFNVNFVQFEKMHALEGGIFFNNEYNFSPRFAISGGLRLSFFNQHGPYNEILRNTHGQIPDTIIHSGIESLAFYINPEPRLVAKYQFGQESSVKASYMRIAQYLHLATSTSASLPLDIWIPSTKKIKPVIGNQISIGYFKNFPTEGIEFSTELYYKTMNNRLELIRGILMSSTDGSIEKNLISGFARAYGIEFYASRKTGNNTGWISYTLSRTENKFDDINEGAFYPAKYDRTHDLSIALARKINKKWNASAIFVYVTGNAFTMPIGRYLIQGNMVNQYGSVNSFRMPPNHRLDISFTRKLAIKKKLESEFVFSIYNVYNRANPFYIYYEIIGDAETYSLEVKAFNISLLPIIPSISWNFNF